MITLVAGKVMVNTLLVLIALSTATTPPCKMAYLAGLRQAHRQRDYSVQHVAVDAQVFED